MKDYLKKKVLNKSGKLNRPYGRLFCILTLLLCVCTDVPEHCGDEHAQIDPRYHKCDGEMPVYKNYKLNVKISPEEGYGMVSRNPDETAYEYGTSVTLTATPDSGYKFAGWSGDTTSADSSLTIKMDWERKMDGEGTMTVTARFEANDSTSTTPPQSGDDFSETAVSGQSFDMVFVKGGMFIMGCTSEPSNCGSDEVPPHSVTLDNYLIGKHEVTQGLWKAVMRSDPSSSDYGVGDDYPVYNVSWNDVQTFIWKLNNMTNKKYRLPTEAEWEYAARGGASSGNYKYSGSGTLEDVGWYVNDNESKTQEVGTKAANELGIHDMSGNVWEWVNDWYSSSYYSSFPLDNPKGPEWGSYRVLRGGSWGSVAKFCRVSYRYYGTPNHCGNGIGFRLAVSP
jgi:formylglycine-generating enzyme required for sulfatase activity